MCGIYGFIGKPTNSEKILDLFIDLGIETEVRGTHATGYYGVNDEVRMNKAPLKATDFYLDHKLFYDFYENPPSVLIGHNRWASCGVPSNNINNHPFINDRFGFIHNGCVKGWVNFKSLGINCESECDSEWIFRYFLKTLEIHHGNIFSAIKKTLNVFDDASIACAMVDSKTKKLWLFRNIGNPICYVINKEQNTLIFASTSNILESACKLHNISTEKIVELDKGQIVCIDEDLNIESETSCNLRGARSSYMTTVAKSWNRGTTYLNPKKKKVYSGTGYKCMKCGKKFVSVNCVEAHLEEVHDMSERLDEDEDIEDYWEDLGASLYPKSVNRKKEFKLVKKSSLKAIESSQTSLNLPAKVNQYSRSKTFEEMQRDTEQCLRELEAMAS